MELIPSAFHCTALRLRSPVFLDVVVPPSRPGVPAGGGGRGVCVVACLAAFPPAPLGPFALARVGRAGAVGVVVFAGLLALDLFKNNRLLDLLAPQWFSH